MVEYTSPIDNVFAALADPVRRDILERVQTTELTVNHIALDYDMSLAAVSKHLKVLNDAGVISKRKSGKYVYVRTNLAGLRLATDYLGQFDGLSMSEGARIR